MLRLLSLLLLLPLSACISPDVIRISGQTMGTTYHVVLVDSDLDEGEIAIEINEVLAQVNAQMSNWDPNSEISRINASTETGPIPISAELAMLLQAAGQIHDQSEGKFDVALGPLIDLWGFGARKPGDALPAPADILAAMARSGQTRQMTLDTEAQTLTKARPDVQIALAAIAKGYGVDAVANALRAHEAENFMVEIGGDLVVSGENEQGEPWSIGIERPDAAAQTVELIVPLRDMAMATSGDYRNFVEHDGQRYSHIIDPVTGQPITHNTTSATVLAENAMLADGWATAMLALGQERGLQIANARGLAVHFITRSEDGFASATSSAFDALLNEK